MTRNPIERILFILLFLMSCQNLTTSFGLKNDYNELKINQLEELFNLNPINEIIIATSPTVNGEATATHIASVAQNFNIKATRIAYGVPFGGEIEYVDSNTLIQAILNRNTIRNQN